MVPSNLLHPAAKQHYNFNQQDYHHHQLEKKRAALMELIHHGIVKFTSSGELSR